MIDYSSAGPVCSAYLRSNARRRVIMGPFGSGKSVASCMDVIARAVEQRPSPRDNIRRTRFAVIRNSYPELKHTTVKTWRAWVGDHFGQFVEAAPFEHRLKFGLADGTTVDSEVLFLAMDKEADAKKFLSLEVTGIYFNEVRELRQALVEAGDGRLGRYPAMKDGGPSWTGLWADTNFPDEDHWIHGLAESNAEGWEFFKQPGGVMRLEGRWVPNPTAENMQNLTPGYYADQLVGKRDDWIKVYLGAEYGTLPMEGAYYAEEMATANSQGRVLDIAVDPALPVHTFWDLGVSDDMAIWFGQGSAGQWRWIDYYENRGKNLQHYANVLEERRKERNYKLGTVVWPHDGSARDMSAQAEDTKDDNAQRRCDTWEKLTGTAPTVLGQHHLGDGIEAVRTLLGTSWFDKKRTADGRRRLERYRREFNEKRNVYSNEPRHDENSHGADAFRTAAMGKDKVSNSTGWGPKIDNSFNTKGIV